MTTNFNPSVRFSRGKALILAFLGLPLLSLLAFFWLEIPDSHIWQLVLSLVLGTAIAVSTLVLLARTIFSLRSWLPSLRATHLAPHVTSPLGVVASAEGATHTSMGQSPLDPPPESTSAERAIHSGPRHWLGVCTLAVWLLIVWVLTHLVRHIEDKADERAGYLNSQLSAHLRATFTYERLIAWQHDLVIALVWIIIPALLLPFLIETVSRGLDSRAWRIASLVLTRWLHWLSVIAAALAGLWLTSKLTGWRPSHSVHGELFSLALRLCICYTADFLIITTLLATDARLLAHEYARRYPAAQPSANDL